LPVIKVRVAMTTLLLPPQGYKQQKAFIIAQGPLKSTCRDFWKMVSDRKCGAIVMLSQLQEEGKVGGA
jgi:protein tyrosine phosphatase